MLLVRIQVLQPVCDGVVDVGPKSVRLQIFFEGVRVRALSRAGDRGKEIEGVFFNRNWAFVLIAAVDIVRRVDLRGLPTL